MPEYYGYQAPEQPNFGKSIANVAELFAAAEEKRSAKREAEQKSLDESRKKINEIEQTSNQSMNGLINNGANNARNYILNLERMRKSGQITGAEFNRRMTNINDSWDNFAFTTKNFNERLAENLLRQQPGEDGKIPASSNEIFLAKIQSDLLNTKNKNIVIGDDGSMYMVDESNPNQPISLKSLGNVDNIVDNRVDVGSLVKDGVSKWGDFGKEVGSTTTLDQRLSDQYNAAKYDLVASIVDPKNPRVIASILLDNSNIDYDQYYNETQKNELLDQAVARQEALKGPMDAEQKSKFKSDYEKNNMIKYEPDENGTYQPVVTDKMIKDATNVVDRQIEMQVGRKTTEDEDRVNKGGGPGNPEDKDNIQDVSSIESKMIADVRSAWKISSASALRKASNDQYFFVYMPKSLGGGVSVFTKNPERYEAAIDQYEKDLAKYEKASQIDKDTGKVKKPDKPKAVEPKAENIKSVDGLYPYFFGSGSTSMEKWKQELEKQRAADSGTTPKKKTTNTTTEPIKFNGQKR